MFSVNKIINNIQLATGIVPVILSVSFIINESLSTLIFCILSLFIIVGTIPLFRKRESLWMFILVAIAGLPINIYLSYFVVSEEIICVGFLIGDILWGILFFCIFFSIEEIVFGIVTRMLWKKQYRIKI